MNLSFSGCGFSGLYHIGVVVCLREHAPKLVDGLNKIAGASAGALAAAMLATGMAAENTIREILQSTNEARTRWLSNLHPSFNLMGHVESTLESFLPENAYKMATDRLSVSLTKCGVFNQENVMAEKFDTQRELINAVCGSCFVPVWGGYGALPYEYRGSYYMDGGFSDNVPQSYPGDTVTVSPFAGEFDICPPTSHPGLDFSIHLKNMPFDLSLANILRLKESLYLPSTLTLVELMRQGYNNCLAYLQIHSLHECSNLSCGEVAHWKDVVPVDLHYLVCDDGGKCEVPTGKPLADFPGKMSADEGYHSHSPSTHMPSSESLGKPPARRSSSLVELEIEDASAVLSSVQLTSAVYPEEEPVGTVTFGLARVVSRTSIDSHGDSGKPADLANTVRKPCLPSQLSGLTGALTDSKAASLTSSALSQCAGFTNWVVGSVFTMLPNAARLRK